MGIHVVLGAGAIGRGTAAELAAAGHTVRLVSRSGRGPAEASPLIEVVSADVTDAAALGRICRGADSVVNALNPAQYWKWEELWPPMAAAILTAVEESGAALVTVGNLYVYGKVDAPMREDQPTHPNGRKGLVRAAMWNEALALHEAGRIRATELRGSDYVGVGMDQQSLLNGYVIKPALAGRAGWLVVGDLDVPHTWTNGRDVARLAATLATDDRSWGSVWHVPSAPARSMSQVAREVAELVGQPVRRPHRIPDPLVAAIGLVYPMLREFGETRHQFEAPFVLDATHTEQTFGLAATPWEQTLRESVDYLSGTAA